MKWVIVQNIPINYCPAVMGDEEGHIVMFNSINDIKNFYIKNGGCSFEILSEEFDIYNFMNEMDLDNCDEQIQEAFENKYINNDN